MLAKSGNANLRKGARTMVTIKRNFSTKQINEALKKGGDIKFEEGEYILKDCLILHSNTNVNANGAKFVRAHKGRMLQLDVSPETTKYKGVHDVKWVGGAFIAHGVPDNANVISLFHGKKIYLYDIYIVGCRGMHSVEVNACSDVILIGLAIREQSSKADETFREAIQIDFANYDGLKVKGAKPDSPCYDGTHCDGVYIKNCSVKDCPNGIGTHTVSKGNKYHKNVRIEACWISTDHKDIRLYGFDGCKIVSTSCNILVGVKDKAHLNSGGKVNLSTPKHNKNVYIEDSDFHNVTIE